MNITVYSTGCPKCDVLEDKLKAKKISFNIVSDIETMNSLGINAVPVLQMGDKFMNYKEAVDWVNKQEENE